MAFVFKNIKEPGTEFDAINTDHILSIYATKRPSRVIKEDIIYSLNFKMSDSSEITWNYRDINFLKLDLSKITNLEVK